MKKILSLALSAALLCTLGTPALAAEPTSADARLTAVTEKVKTRLALDTSAYDSFHGDLEESAVVPTWNLQWSGEDSELSISATESGKILSYDLYEERGVSPYRGPTLDISFPKLTREDAQKTAQSFLDKVLDGGVESARFEESQSKTPSVTSHSFYGEVLENGLPSPFSFRVSVRVSDNTVTGFYLNGSPESFSGGVPAATPSADAAKAGDSLKSTLKLRLEYVLEEDGKSAVLRYRSEYGHDYYVDAQTGRLVDLTELGEGLWYMGKSAKGVGGASNRAEADLTEAEQEGIAQMEGVLPKESLDAAARKITALGLSKYTLSAAKYHVNEETGDVSAALQYAYNSGYDIYRRTVTLNAKSAALLTVDSYHPWKDGEKASIAESAAQAEAEAEAFLKTVCPDQFAKTARYGQRDADNENIVYSFCFAARENGYFLPESRIAVGVDGTDGSICTYYNGYIPDVTFQSPEGIVSMDAALTAWFDTYDVTLGYLAVPEKLNLSQPNYKVLIERGWKYLSTQKLAYYLARDGWYLGVDAKTGAVVSGETAEKTIAYDDLAGHWIKGQAEKLAEYGVGWLGGSLRPGEALTQLDLVALLVSTGGYHYSYDSGGSEAADQLYRMAYSMGILKKADRDDGAVLTRAEMVKLLLNSAGYGSLAGLEGIFRCDYADESSIPAEYYGYAAVAQALGLVKGGPGGVFAPGRAATRAEAVSMLYNFMSR